MDTHSIDLTVLAGEITWLEDLGDFVVDLETAIFHKPRLALDYIHEESEVIGYCENFRTEKKEAGEIVLKADGVLLPFREGDRASEIAYKSKAGVPFEASPLLDDEKADTEVFPAGESVQVNGRIYQHSGPLKVLRKCPIRGVAVCPYGNDRKTNSSVLKRAGLSKPMEKPKMSETTETPVEETTETKITNPELAEFVEQFGLEKGYQMYQAGVSLDEVKQFAELKAKLGFDDEPKAEAATASDGEPPAAAPVTQESDDKKELKRLSALVKEQGAQLAKLSFTRPRGVTEPLSSGAIEDTKEPPKKELPKTGVSLMAAKYQANGVKKI